MSITETQRLQTEIRILLKEVGWDLHRFVRELVIDDEQNDVREELTVEKELAKLKKALTRPTTKPPKLHFYLNFIIEKNRRRALYKIPMLDSSLFNQDEINMFESIGEISKRVFEEEN